MPPLCREFGHESPICALVITGVQLLKINIHVNHNNKIEYMVFYRYRLENICYL